MGESDRKRPADDPSDSQTGKARLPCTPHLLSDQAMIVLQNILGRKSEAGEGYWVSEDPGNGWSASADPVVPSTESKREHQHRLREQWSRAEPELQDHYLKTVSSAAKHKGKDNLDNRSKIRRAVEDCSTPRMAPRRQTTPLVQAPLNAAPRQHVPWVTRQDAAMRFWRELKTHTERDPRGIEFFKDNGAKLAERLEQHVFITSVDGSTYANTMSHIVRRIRKWSLATFDIEAIYLELMPH